MLDNFASFFTAVTERSSFKYQERFAALPLGLTTLNVPTGMGKTDTVLVDWLYRRAISREHTPTRLVWCLPGRALTEQVYVVARERVAKA